MRLIGLFVFGVLLILFDLGVGRFFQYAYETSKYGVFARQIHCLTNPIEDILVLGSSRAAHHYIPSIIQDSLNMTCYNAGSDGMCIYYHYAILSSWIKKHTPQLILYDVTETDLLSSNSSTFSLEAALDRLSPHYKTQPEIDSLFYLQGWRKTLKMNSMMYRYNSKLVQLIKCHFIPSYEDAGYEVVYGQLPDSMEIPVIDNLSTNYELNKEIYLCKLIQMTKIENIKLIFIYSPKYKRGCNTAIDRIKRIAEENTIPFIDMVNTPSLMYPKYFRDELHLNDEGAKIFSKYLVSEVKKTLVKYSIIELDYRTLQDERVASR